MRVSTEELQVVRAALNQFEDCDRILREALNSGELTFQDALRLLTELVTIRQRMQENQMVPFTNPDVIWGIHVELVKRAGRILTEWVIRDNVRQRVKSQESKIPRLLRSFCSERKEEFFACFYALCLFKYGGDPAERFAAKILLRSVKELKEDKPHAESPRSDSQPEA